MIETVINTAVNYIIVAERQMDDEIKRGRSLQYVKKKETNTVPCGTPDITGNSWEKTVFNENFLFSLEGESFSSRDSYKMSI